jgi:hypothetical protein
MQASVVFPAKAGTQTPSFSSTCRPAWAPAFAGVTR